jgi:hypothetical protein
LVSSADMTGPADRLKWVDHALRTLDEDFRMWLLENDPNPITVEYQPEANVHAFRLGTQVPPVRFGIVASNIVHQVRATLDNIVWQLVIANGREPTAGSRGNQFPIINALKDNRTFSDYTRNSLAGVHPDNVAVIEGLQPYQNPEWGPGRHPLAMLADLSNADKHQVLKVVTAERPMQDPVDLPVVFGGPEGVVVLDSGYLRPDRRYAGAVVGWAIFAPPGFHPDAYMHAEFWAQLAFADGLRVFPVLNTLYAVVDTLFWMFRATIENGAIAPVFRLDEPTANLLLNVMRQKRGYIVG